MYLLGANLLLMVLLSPVVVNDFKHRTIHAWLLPPILLVLIARIFFFEGFTSFAFQNCGLNVFLLSMQFLALWIYFNKLKGKTLSRMIGLGDILLLYTLCFALPVFYFILLGTLSCILGLVAKQIFPTKFTTIPLAAWLAIVLMAFLIIEIVQGKTYWELMYAV